MDIVALIVTVLGLCLFEVVSSIDNAVINAEVLNTMSARARRWFLVWGLFFAVFLVRGLLPWLIVWIATPGVGFIGSFSAAFSNNPEVAHAVERAAPVLLVGGGIFLVFLFLHWLFLEPKNIGLRGERFFMRQGVWFYAIVSIILCVVVWFSVKTDPFMALSAVVGSSAFFITHGFKQNAEKGEQMLLSSTSNISDISKILYLEIIDMTFSIDGVLGAFAFTLSVPLIILGNGLGAVVLRQLTISNIDRIKKYAFLKNGAMYSIFFLGMIMLVESFGMHLPKMASPIITFAVIAYFFIKSKRSMNDVPPSSHQVVNA